MCSTVRNVDVGHNKYNANKKFIVITQKDYSK